MVKGADFVWFARRIRRRIRNQRISDCEKARVLVETCRGYGPALVDVLYGVVRPDLDR